MSRGWSRSWRRPWGRGPSRAGTSASAGLRAGDSHQQTGRKPIARRPLRLTMSETSFQHWGPGDKRPDRGFGWNSCLEMPGADFSPNTWTASIGSRPRREYDHQQASQARPLYGISLSRRYAAETWHYVVWPQALCAPSVHSYVANRPSRPSSPARTSTRPHSGHRSPNPSLRVVGTTWAQAASTPTARRTKSGPMTKQSTRSRQIGARFPMNPTQIGRRGQGKWKEPETMSSDNHEGPLVGHHRSGPSVRIWERKRQHGPARLPAVAPVPRRLDRLVGPGRPRGHVECFGCPVPSGAVIGLRVIWSSFIAQGSPGFTRRRIDRGSHPRSPTSSSSHERQRHGLPKLRDSSHKTFVGPPSERTRPTDLFMEDRLGRRIVQGSQPHATRTVVVVAPRVNRRPTALSQPRREHETHAKRVATRCRRIGSRSLFVVCPMWSRPGHRRPTCAAGAGDFETGALFVGVPGHSGVGHRDRGGPGRPGERGVGWLPPSGGGGVMPCCLASSAAISFMASHSSIVICTSASDRALVGRR